MGIPASSQVRDNMGKSVKIDVLREVVYLIDFSVPYHLPELEHDLRRNFAMDLLPGGLVAVLPPAARRCCV